MSAVNMPDAYTKMEHDFEGAIRHRDATLKLLKQDQLTYLQQEYLKAKQLQEDGAYNYMFNIVGAMMRMLGAAFDPNDSLGKALSAAGPILEGISGFNLSLNKADVEYTQGLISQVRETLDTSKEHERQLLTLSNRIWEMLDEVRKNARRDLSSALNAH